MVLYVFRRGSEKRIRHALLRFPKATLIQEHTGLCFLCPNKIQSQLQKVVCGLKYLQRQSIPLSMHTYANKAST